MSQCHSTKIIRGAVEKRGLEKKTNQQTHEQNRECCSPENCGWMQRYYRYPQKKKKTTPHNKNPQRESQMQARNSPFRLLFLVKNRTSKGAAAPEQTLHSPGCGTPSLWAELGTGGDSPASVCTPSNCGGFGTVYLLKMGVTILLTVPRSTAGSQTQRPACWENSGAPG